MPENRNDIMGYFFNMISLIPPYPDMDLNDRRKRRLLSFSSSAP